MTIKQIIVMRKDLKMRRGKEIAQGCHACMKVFMDICQKEQFVKIQTTEYSQYRFVYENGDVWDKWLNGIFTKICVTVNSEQELIDIYDKAVKIGLPAAMIEDNGLTEFNGVKTKTCCAIGPADSDTLQPITGQLPLY
jgi:PTH2 family peptidyl-tRNA hydrolase